ncbi:MAG: hypothetical protein IT222_01430 [Crocinitomix sp.]|nr:hypothetical protein [Crocinitomix sp.]
MPIILILVVFISLSCTNKKDAERIEKSEIFQDDTNLKTNAGIIEIDSMSFRRSYVGHENLSEKELDELKKSNPTALSVNSNSEIVKKLNELNILTNNDLNLQKFENQQPKKEYLDEKNTISFNCNYDALALSNIDFTVKNAERKDGKTLNLQGEQLVGITLQDVDNNQIKEILVLTTYYIMNGDNFRLLILKYQ